MLAYLLKKLGEALKTGVRLKRKLNNLLDEHVRETYSQFGEDIIISNLFQRLDISFPSYLDVGAHHPRHLSNTYLFYKNGCKGVCVEPDPELYSLFRLYRPRDTVVRLGVGTKVDEEMAELFVYRGQAKGLNSFLREKTTEVKKYSKLVPDHIVMTRLVNINELIAKYFDRDVDLLSIDVEGMDLPILKTLNYEINSPKVICVEVSKRDQFGNVVKNEEVDAFLNNKGYLQYAHTFINGIYLRADLEKVMISNWD